MKLKRICLALMALLCLQMVCAQSMTDEQVVRYVQEQQEKGKDQQYIVQQLLRRGVTTDQLRRIKKKYDAEQSQPGAVDLTGSTQTSTKSRLRTSEEQQADERQKRQGYMIRSQREITDEKDRTYRQQQLSEEIGFFDIDSLIYYQNYFREDESAVFGRNIFNNELLTFEPSLNIPTPSNYRLGAGDDVIIDVWGASQITFEGTISPDGTVTIEGVGPLSLSGRTVKEANEYVQQQLGHYYSGSNIALTLGETRSIQVQVMGEVNVPGSYSLSALSTAFNALYAAGGINNIGTLRDIKVYRQGRIITVIDVYDFILNGNTASDVRLEDNDVIVVGPYDCLVNLRGKVKRPMYYEMKNEESVARIISYAGGFTGDARTDNIRLIRKSGREYSVYTIDEFEMNGFKLKDGDSLYIDSVIPRFANMAEVRGAVFHPGQYQMDKNINTVRALIKAADGLKEDAYTDRALLHRQKDDLTIEAISVDITGIMAGTTPDIPLHKNDILFIPSRTEMLGERTITIDGEVNFPGIYQYAEHTTIEDIVLQAGGLTQAASYIKVDVFRRVNDPTASTSSNTTAETFSFALNDKIAADSANTFYLQPFDEVYVRKNPVFTELGNVTINGAVTFSGDYAIETRNYRLSDLIKAAGGLTNYAYPKGARLQRTMTPSERTQREALLRSTQIQLYEESLTATDKNYNLSRADSVMEMKLDLGNTYPLAINLQAALEEPGSDDDILLREGDIITVPQYSNTVKISGEVMYPIAINYEKGKPLSYYIKRAGGYSTRAKKKGTYAIYMNGSVEQLGRKDKGKNIEPGCEIVIPTKPSKAQLTTAERLSIGTSTASIAAMIATVVSVIND